jgi:quercetin dioxygenase-like cupin family protein
MSNEQGFTSMFLEEGTMAPGSEVPLHTHPIEEGWVVLEGELDFRVGDEWHTAGAQHVVHIPAGERHAVRNAGAEVARILTAAPWPRNTFFQEATTYLEGTPRVD